MHKTFLLHGLRGNLEDFNIPILLNIAVESRCLKFVEDLLKYGAGYYMQTSSSFRRGLTPLHCAVMGKHVAMAKLLINYGANVNVKSDVGTTPIVHAILHNDTEMIELLSISGADIKEDLNIRCIAAYSGCLKIVEDLLKDGIDVNALTVTNIGESLTLLHIAVKGKQLEMAKLLINYGANVNVKDGVGTTPIIYAIRHNDIEMIELLSINGADIKEDPNILCVAAASGCFKLVLDLLKDGADVNMLTNSGFGKSFAPLHNAVKGKQALIVTLLINYGANVNIRNSRGTTPLFYAIKKGDTEMTKLLLNNGANIKACSNILAVAVKRGNLKIVEDLLKDGADVNMVTVSKSGRSFTLLHMAAVGRQVEMVKLLIHYGVDVNVEDNDGITPLIYAIKKRDTEITELLLNNGADIKEDVKTDLLPRSSQITELLKRHIAKVKAAGLHVSKENLLWISSDEEMNNFLIKCEAEVGTMKSEKIRNSYASFYDILIKNTSQLAKNESIVHSLKSDNYKTKFPIYASTIDSRFRRGLEREELLEQVRNKFSHSLFARLPKLPLLCTEKIVSNLRDSDLRIVLVACKRVV